MKQGVAEGYTNLYFAIRDVDGEDEEWREYWVERPEMRAVWRILADGNGRHSARF